MIMERQIIIDEWEGDAGLDDTTLLKYVTGVIVRINDMAGGHHIDVLFTQRWEAAKLYPARAIYFVYNPWVDGKANYAWLKANLPSG